MKYTISQVVMAQTFHVPNYIASKYILQKQASKPEENDFSIITAWDLTYPSQNIHVSNKLKRRIKSFNKFDYINLNT